MKKNYFLSQQKWFVTDFKKSLANVISYNFLTSSLSFEVIFSIHVYVRINEQFFYDNEIQF